jgi:hypothetical protein
MIFIHLYYINFLAELYLKQKGLCVISNVPLQTKGNYSMSIERINTSLGYEKSNVSLICVCFQSTQRQGEQGTGGGWTKKKWEEIVDKFSK